jgi:hypothetical protein
MVDQAPPEHPQKRRRFVMGPEPRLTQFPVKQPPGEPTVVSCDRCTDTKVWCFSCETAHPMIGVDGSLHLYRCPLSTRVLHRNCPRADAPRIEPAASPLSDHEHRERTRLALKVGTICLLLGFLLGSGMTLATVLLMNFSGGHR